MHLLPYKLREGTHMSNIEDMEDLRPPDPTGKDKNHMMSLRSMTEVDPPPTQLATPPSESANHSPSCMEEEPSPLVKPTQSSTYMSQLAESLHLMESKGLTTSKLATNVPQGDDRQVHTGPGPSDGGTKHVTLPTPQGPNPDVNMAELLDEITDEAEDTIQALKGDINLIRLGLASYYPGSTDLALRRESIIEIDAVQLQKATSIVITLLNLGIPNPEETAFTGLVPSSWHRLVALLLAATLRGAKRTPNILKQGSTDIRPCLDQFTVHNNIPIPKTQGDLLQDLVAQLAGTLDARPPLGEGDANPESFFDAIKLKLNANYEHVAEVEAQKEAALWAQWFMAGLYNNELDTIIKKVQAMLGSAEWARELQKQCMDNLQAESKQCHAQALAEAKSEVEYKARRVGKEEKMCLFRLAISLGQKEALTDAEAHLKRLEESTVEANSGKLRQWVENQLALDKAVRRDKIQKLADEEYHSSLEKGIAEACLRADSEAHNWAVAYKAEKTEALQLQLDAAVGADDRQAVTIVAIQLGMDLGGTAPTKSPHTRKKKKLPKSRTGVRASVERGCSGSRTGQKRPAANMPDGSPEPPARDPSVTRAMSTTPTQVEVPLPLLAAPVALYRYPHDQETAHEVVLGRWELKEIISRIHTLAPLESVGTEGSMHRLIMLDPIELPHEFNDRELRGPLSSVHNPVNHMLEQADLSPRVAVASAILPQEEGEWGDARDSSEAPLELVAAAYGGTLTPDFTALVTVVQGMLAPLRDDISMLSAHLNKQEFGGPSPKDTTPKAGPARSTPTNPQQAPPGVTQPTQAAARATKAPPPPSETPAPVRRG